VGEPRGAPQPGTGASEDADVHAFLIGDMRGWTSFTQEHGDERAARLAARFAEVTRAVVEDQRGRVVELRGDEVMAVFGSPRSAIRAAVTLQQRFVEESLADPSLPLTVGIGLDAGEAVPVQGGYRGGALNVAGRLQARARAGEVLASREIVHLARRIDGIRFIERGPLELKGLEQPVHVIVVSSEDQDAAEAMAPFVRSTASARTPRRRWRVVAALAAFALLAALVAVPLALRDGGSSEIASNSIGILDPDSGAVVSTLGLGARPGSIAASADDVWVTNPDLGTVTRIDTSDREIRDRIQVGENPTGIAVGEGAVWVVNSGGPSVSRISAETGEVFDPIPVGNGPAGIAVGEGSVWVTNRFDGTISRIDPSSSEVIDIPVGFDPRGIVVGFDGVWVALPGSNKVVRVDPATNDIAEEIDVGNGPESLAASEDALWVGNVLDDTVSSIDPGSGRVTSVLEVGDAPSRLALVDGTVWAANEGDGTLSEIEPGRAAARRVLIGSVPQGLAPVGVELWVSVSEAATSHQGGTLRVASYYPPVTLDPAVAYTPFDWRVLPLTGDGLVAFNAVGGIDGQTLVPDLATSLPGPTDEGKTYVFHLREGIRYSDGEVVRPEDFRRAIERVFLLKSDGVHLLGGLVGGEACTKRFRTCDLSKGIMTDEDAGTITFHLTASDPDFLYKLALPFTYPVPPSVPDEEQRRAGVPGTGPYMLESPQTADGLVLVRNPHFRVWSADAQPGGNADRIEWSFPRSGSLVGTVTGGEADIATDPPSSQLDEILVRFAGQVHTAPLRAIVYIALHAEVPPFDDVHVRRAVNFALDRERVVEILGGDAAALLTCQQIPPNFPGYGTYCPYAAEARTGEEAWTAPDPEEAERLVERSGTAGMRVTYWFNPTIYGCCEEALAKYMVEMLESLGYRASARPVEEDELLYDPANRFQMAFNYIGADYPSASTFITPLGTCDAGSNSSAFCDPRIDAMVERATRVQARDPIAAQTLWREIDRAIVDQAPSLWLVNPIGADFTSPQVGNYQVHPQWGVLLGQLWVQ
jgi:ABC-type transport system substrate-binding protein/class 3 adenylate cyclase